MIKHVNKEEFNKEVTNKLVLVDFYADWCGPCKMLGPVLEELSKQNPDLLILKVNVDEEEELAYKFGVTSIPTVISFKEGKEYKKSIGFMGMEALKELIK